MKRRFFFAAVAAPFLGLSLPQRALAYGATARTVSGTTVTNRLFSPNPETLAPVNTRIWFVADTKKDGVPTSPTPGAILGADDVLIFEDVVDGTIVGAQAGKYQRIGIEVPETLKDANIYFYLWNYSSPLSSVPQFQPADGANFGLLKLGVIPPPAIGNAAWDVTNNVVSTQYRVGSVAANRPPVMEAPAAQSIKLSVPWTLQLLAADPDVPAQALQFAVTNAPAGLVINATTGRVEWTPTAVGEFLFDAIVTDNGTPPQSATARLNVTVRPNDTTPFQLALITAEAGKLELTWPSQPGRKYRLESTQTLSPLNWEPARELDETGELINYTTDLTGDSRFFRVIQLP